MLNNNFIKLEHININLVVLNANIFNLKEHFLMLKIFDH